MASTIDKLKNRALSALSHERQDLEAQKVALEKRQELALRRLRAYTMSKEHPESTGWLQTPQDIAETRRRLEVALTNEEVLLKLIDEVRAVKDALTVQAFALHAARCTDQFEGMDEG